MQTKIKYLSFRFYVPILLAIVALFIYSCRKDIDRSNEGITDDSILEAKSWYENVYPGSKGGKVITSSLADADLSQIIKPNWLKAHTYKRFNGNVIELPISSSSKFGSVLAHGANKRPVGSKEYSRSSFIILNNNGKYDAYVMTLIADSSYIKNDINKLALNTYNKRDPNYSGLVLYFTPKGKYISGWRYKNGKLVEPNAAPAGIIDTKAQNSVYKKPANYEQAYCEDWWWITENEDGVITSITFLYTVCYPGGGSGGGEAPSPPPRCPGMGTNSIKNKIINGNAPWEPGPTNPGDDGGFPPPGSSGEGCAVPGQTPGDLDTTSRDSAQKIIDEFCQGLLDSQKETITDAIENFKNDNCTNNNFFKWLFQHNIKFTFCVDENLTVNANFDQHNMTIKFSDGIIPSNVIAEELFHYYQGTEYGDMNQFGSSNGKANIEFEAALWRDIKQGSAGAGALNAAPVNINSDYKLWIYNITNHDTTFPKKIEDLEGRYNYFLEQFNTYRNFGITIDKAPSAMFKNFSIFGCK